MTFSPENDKFKVPDLGKLDFLAIWNSLGPSIIFDTSELQDLPREQALVARLTFQSERNAYSIVIGNHCIHCHNAVNIVMCNIGTTCRRTIN